MNGEKKIESLDTVKSRMKAKQTLIELNGERLPSGSRHNRQPITELISDSRRVTPGSAFLHCQE